MSRESGKTKKANAEKGSAPKAIDESPETKLNRLCQIANIADYWRNEPSSLLFTHLSRADQFVRESTGDLKKILEGWDAMLDKVREVRSIPKVKVAIETLMKVSSAKNPWRIMSFSMSFIGLATIFLAIYLIPDLYIIVVPVIFVLMFALQIYSQRRISKAIKYNVDAIEKSGGEKIKELSESCKDLTQTVVNQLKYELPKYGRSSDTFTLRLLSNDYSGVKLRVEEKVKKRGRRTGDLYSVVWK